MKASALFAAAPVVLAGMFLAPVAQGPVCSCPGAPLEARVRQAETIVLGTVTELTDRGVVVAVERYLKGSGPNEIAVIDASREAGCGTLSPNDEGRRMIVLMDPSVSRTNYPYTTWHCQANMPRGAGDVNEGEIELFERITGQGQPPEGDDLPRAAMWAGAIVLPLAFLAASVLWAGRKS